MTMTPIRLHFSLILDTSAYQDPERAVKQFLAAGEFADVEKSVEVVRGTYVVRYTVDGPETLTELRRALNHMAKALFSEATQTAIQNERTPQRFPHRNARPFARVRARSRTAAQSGCP
jgi:hypothetical protein